MLILQLRDESTELEELREMKADIARREKAQATVIDNQARRLEELETLYKVPPCPCMILVYAFVAFQQPFIFQNEPLSFAD